MTKSKIGRGTLFAELKDANVPNPQHDALVIQRNPKAESDNAPVRFNPPPSDQNKSYRPVEDIVLNKLTPKPRRKGKRS